MTDPKTSSTQGAASVGNDGQASELSPLREEIRQSENSRLEFLKYKLIAVATLAAVAFGLGSWNSTDPDLTPRYVLAVIPYVCLYVDALCYHNNLRILVIAKYLRCHEDPYENFLGRWDQVRTADSALTIREVFNLEGWILEKSTLALSAMVFVAGVFTCDPTQRVIIGLAGLSGILLSSLLKLQYSRRYRTIHSTKCRTIADMPPRDG